MQFEEALSLLDVVLLEERSDLWNSACEAGVSEPPACGSEFDLDFALVIFVPQRDGALDAGPAEAEAVGVDFSDDGGDEHGFESIWCGNAMRSAASDDGGGTGSPDSAHFAVADGISLASEAERDGGVGDRALGVGDDLQDSCAQDLCCNLVSAASSRQSCTVTGRLFHKKDGSD